jgi:protein gp37
VAAAYAGTTHRTGDRVDWTGTVNLLADRLTQPLRARKPSRIFVNSMSDLFHGDVPDAHIAKTWATMALAPWHSFQVLTRRPARMRALLSSDAFRGQVAQTAYLTAMGEGEIPLSGAGLARARATHSAWPAAFPDATVARVMPWPLPNVWVGVSAENQKWADIRIPLLLATPAAVHWVSAEPLLGPINLRGRYLGPGGWRDELTGPMSGGNPDSIGRLDWVVVGGESGPRARPMHPDWARSLRDQCAAAGVAYHFKQWGSWAPAEWKPEPLPGEDSLTYMTRANADGATHAYAVDAHRYGWEPYKAPHKPWSTERTSLDGSRHTGIRSGSKSRTGRLLDGRTHDAYPEAVTARG